VICDYNETVYSSTNNKIPEFEEFAFGFCEYPRIKLHILLLGGNFFQCCVFAMKYE
jgi:hypothetical protein